jgi:transcriptional antiterminator NusG
MAELEDNKSEATPPSENGIDEIASTVEDTSNLEADAVIEAEHDDIDSDTAEGSMSDEGEVFEEDQEMTNLDQGEPIAVVDDQVETKVFPEADDVSILKGGIPGEDEIVEDSASVDAETPEDLEAESDVVPSPDADGEAESEEQLVEAPEGEPDDGRLWYVVHCYSGYENKVRHNLEQRIDSMGMKSKIFDVVVPTEEEIEVKDGKRRTVERRVFPGYILVQMILTEESWYVVRNTPGVTGFVGQGNEPIPLRPEEVTSIVKRMEAEAPRIKVTYSLGQKVRIIDGPFNDFIGTVDDIDMEKAKVRVMVSFFGRETPVELDFLQVEKA